jgi:hypothetical protein
MIGGTFGRWTVIGDAPPHNKATMWRCRCECGTEKDVNGKSMRLGLSTSCGCFNTQKARAQGTHKQSGRENGNRESAEYRIWTGIRKRCLNPNAQRYESYGGRGIKICERWDKFQNFFDDMGSRPSLRHSIDRENNDGDYEPGNCRWSTPEEQANNTRRNIIVLIDGERTSLPIAARKLGISYSSVYRRLRSGKLQMPGPAFPMADLRRACGFSGMPPRLP